MALAAAEPLASPSVLVLAGLLHDAGKADEYRWVHRRFELSDRGHLIGHRHTLLEWLAAARAQYRVMVPEAHYLALIHVLTAAKGAPAWLGGSHGIPTRPTSFELRARTAILAPPSAVEPP